ncbi:carboxymuconolactone decarboxylase family protein [Microbacterium sp.]|jgi:alkylhydroperoxidase family enzyme|uniref:carboxymuconolactone decarboxylase family protein n=1 Tax=Microbacterium sp. TaxID=51671 RepID=UPI002C45B39D|nr:carboxymuconolactone decarboxylase family protein [Microbacterium sp.]HWL78640.1 carboxymuconolactone decarboxylase family protein [Microbacterium sp.]
MNDMEDDMTTDTRIPAAEVSGVYGALVKAFAKKMMGRVPDSVGILWQNQRVMKDAMGIGQKVEKWDQLDHELATYAAMAAAATVGCSFCLDFNYFLSRNRGLDVMKVREVPRWRSSDVFSPLERQVMEYAELASQTPPAVTDELSNTLLEQLGAPALVELAARVAFMNMSARMNIALGIRSEHFADACGMPALADRTPVGDAA